MYIFKEPSTVVGFLKWTLMLALSPLTPFSHPPLLVFMYQSPPCFILTAYSISSFLGDLSHPLVPYCIQNHCGYSVISMSIEGLKVNTHI